MPSTYASIHYHVVFATNRRAPIIGESWRSDMHAYLGGIVKTLDCVPICIGGVADHVHLLIGLKPRHAISDVVREVKKVSSVWANEKHFRGFEWQKGYGAFTFSYRELPSLTNYVLGQEEHHRLFSSADELRALLAEAGVEYNPQFFE